MLFKKNEEKIQNKKLVRYANGQGFEHFRTFSKENFDFLTSKIQFSSNVPILKVVQNTILYIFYIYHFFIEPKFNKPILNDFGQGTDYSGKRIFDTNSPENIYDANRNERFLHVDDDFENNAR